MLANETTLKKIALTPTMIAAAYLLAISVCELFTTLLEPTLGLGLYGILLIVMLLHAVRLGDHPLSRLLLVLIFAPLIRITSFTLPLPAFPRAYWYFITSVPLFVGAALVARTIRIPDEIKRAGWWDIAVQVQVALSGLALGYIEYQILRPTPLIDALTPQEIFLPAMILLICTGFLEELIFRRLMQHTAIAALNKSIGVIYVAAIFAILHVGYRSVFDVVFVFGVGLYFGVVVLKTGRLSGVTVAHGLTNILLFLVMPFLPV
jgi:uncharacterized protein